MNSTLQSVGDLTVGSPVKLTITAATGDVAGNGLGTFGGGLANQIRLSGSVPWRSATSVSNCRAVWVSRNSADRQ